MLTTQTGKCPKTKELPVHSGSQLEARPLLLYILKYLRTVLRVRKTKLLLLCSKYPLVLLYLLPVCSSWTNTNINQIKLNVLHWTYKTLQTVPGLDSSNFFFNGCHQKQWLIWLLLRTKWNIPSDIIAALSVPVHSDVLCVSRLCFFDSRLRPVFSQRDVYILTACYCLLLWAKQPVVKY